MKSTTFHLKNKEVYTWTILIRAFYENQSNISDSVFLYTHISLMYSFSPTSQSCFISDQMSPKKRGDYIMITIIIVFDLQPKPEYKTPLDLAQHHAGKK